MIKIFEYAKLSQHVYYPNSPLFNRSKNIVLNIPDKLPQNYTGWMICSNVDAFLKPNKFFYAALYLKFSNGQATDAVVAIRGTQVLVDGLVDVYSWYSAAAGNDWHVHLPPYYTSAQKFMSKVETYLQKNFPNLKNSTNLSITGHSLGGALAQLLTLRYSKTYPCVVFNSPGCQEIAGNMLLNRWKSVINFNARYDVVNKIGHTVGTLNVIDVPEEEAEAKIMFEHFNKADFQKSVTIEQVANKISNNAILTTAANAVGMDYRIGSISGSVMTVAKSAEAHQAFITCETSTVLNDWNNLTMLSQKAMLCSITPIVSTFSKVMAAQHSIDNMVKAVSKIKFDR